MTTIYHNPRCKKSRAGLAYLMEKEKDVRIREYLKEPLTPEELKEIMEMTGLEAYELIRTREEAYRQNLKGKNLSPEEWMQVILENPKLLKRPIVLRGKKGVWADPPEQIDLLY